MCPLFTAFDWIIWKSAFCWSFASPWCSQRVLCREVYIRGTKVHAVALVEAHEMLVNKEIKSYVVRPSNEYLNKIMYYYPVRSKVCKQLKEKLSPLCPRDTTWKSDSMQWKLLDVYVLHGLQGTTGLIITLNGTLASSEQHISLRYLCDPSAMVPQRKQHLQIFSAPKRRPTKVKLKEKLISRCLRKQLAWSGQTHCPVQDQQYLELPCAQCTPAGEPHKGQKSYAVPWFWEGFLVCGSLTLLFWRVCSCNTAPLVTHATMRDYAVFLVKKSLI